MKRGSATLNNWEENGTEKAMQLASALGTICDEEFLRQLIAIKSAFDQWGGQYVVAAKRERVNANGEIDPDGAEFVTVGYIHHFQHIPDVLKNAVKEPATELGQVEWPEANGNGHEPDPEEEPSPIEEPEVPEPAPVED